VHGLRLADVNLGDNSARVHEKGNKSRIIYYDPETATALADYLEVRPATTHDWFWVTKRGRHVSESGLRQILRRICDRAGLPDIGAHRLRHTFAFESVSAGADPDQLREQLGHNHLSTTYKNYVRWTDKERKETFNKAWLGDLKSADNRPKLRVLKRASE
jgi:site-specific recombinase XerD